MEHIHRELNPYESKPTKFEPAATKSVLRSWVAIYFVVAACITTAELSTLDQHRERYGPSFLLPYILLGVPLSLGLFYCAYLSLRELSAADVVVVVASAATLQLLVSTLTAILWEHRLRQNDLSIKTKW